MKNQVFTKWGNPVRIVRRDYRHSDYVIVEFEDGERKSMNLFSLKADGGIQTVNRMIRRTEKSGSITAAAQWVNWIAIGKPLSSGLCPSPIDMFSQFYDDALDYYGFKFVNERLVAFFGNDR